mgnify:CR=1 FL=1
MIVTINRAEFLDAAKRAASIAPAESPLDVLKGALMAVSTLRLSTRGRRISTARASRSPPETGGSGLPIS